MLKRKMKYLPFFIFTALIFGSIFSVVFAQTQISLGSPIGDAKTPAEMVGNLYKFSLLIAGASAFAVMIYGAIIYATSAGNSSKQQDAKEWIYGAVWGVVLLLSAYLILYTINPNLVNLVNPALEKIDVSSLQAGDLTEEGIREQFSQQNIGTKSACNPDQTQACVNLGGMRQDTINEIFSISREVGSSNVFVTGGTEGGHADGINSHSAGYKFDLRPNNALSEYIKNTFEKISENRYSSPTGAVYVFESGTEAAPSDATHVNTGIVASVTYAHWDVYVPSKQ